MQINTQQIRIATTTITRLAKPYLQAGGQSFNNNNTNNNNNCKNKKEQM